MPRIAAFRKTLSRPVSCGWKPAPVAISPAIRPRVSTCAGVGLHHAVDQLEQRALAGAVEPHQTDRLALLDREGDVVDGQEGVADLLAPHRRDRDLLDRAVVAHGELFARVVEPRSTRSCQRRSANLPSRRENASWQSTRMTSGHGEHDPAEQEQVLGQVRVADRGRVAAGRADRRDRRACRSRAASAPRTPAGTAAPPTSAGWRGRGSRARCPAMLLVASF